MKLRFLLLTILLACTLATRWVWSEVKSTMKKQPFGKLSDGREVDLYTLTNKHGMEVAITNFGGIVVTLKVPDRVGKVEDVVLGYDSLDGYLTNKAFFGAPSVATAIASATLRSLSTARRTLFRKTTATTRCTAGRRASTSACGPPGTSRVRPGLPLNSLT